MQLFVLSLLICICLVETLIATTDHTATPLYRSPSTTTTASDCVNGTCYISCYYCSTATDDDCDDTFDTERQLAVKKCNDAEFCFKTRRFYSTVLSILSYDGLRFKIKNDRVSRLNCI